MTVQSRASVAELTAEFERAMESLADSPVANTDSECIIAALDRQLGNAESIIIGRESGWAEADSDAQLLEAFIRIAAIALEGAARLRRQS